MSNPDLKKLFLDKSLFKKALTHRSWVNEHKGTRESNERFEFLGDAVLELTISQVIFKKFPDKEEGYLTALRATLVNTKNLAKVARKLALGDLIYLSKGEEIGGGRKNSSLLANTVEAIIGALYIDQGILACEKFIEDYILIDLSDKVSSPLKDPKSLLQEFVQNKGIKPPKYSIISSYGPDHAKIFTVQVKANGKTLSKATGTSKAEASQKAAKKALALLGKK